MIPKYSMLINYKKWKKTTIFKKYDEDKSAAFVETVDPKVFDPNFEPSENDNKTYMLGRRISPSHPRGDAPKFVAWCIDNECQICRTGELNFNHTPQPVRDALASGKCNSIDSQVLYTEESRSPSPVRDNDDDNNTPIIPLVRKMCPTKGDEMLLLIRYKDERIIASFIEELRKPNGYTIDLFEEEDEIYRYEINLLKEMKNCSIKLYQYHPVVRRVHKEEKGSSNFDSMIKYEVCNNGGKIRHVYEKKNTAIKSNKAQNPGGLCPYCEKITFAEFKNSTYLHHLNKQHGVFSNGDSIPKPLSHGVYISEVRKLRVEAVECPDCQMVIPLSATNKPLLGYLRHYSDEHKKGSKLDHKAKKEEKAGASMATKHMLN